ncbi:MAG: hypothetical protein A7316_06545 [Candidatus Altiarchaeales archaeon WOR_SM1_86-2]|nr:MAG: hypothetical protein A7316_06545 [Candidatus Altiarchaeales archaeon WOR_SM1_86-2]
MNKKIKLIAFDLDGVLVDSKGGWKEVHNGLGTANAAKPHEKLFYRGEITFDEWALMDVELWKGRSIDRIKEILDEIPPMKGASYAIPKLGENYILAIISGGLKLLADRIKDNYGFHYAIGNALKVNGGKVTGISQSVGFNDKGKILRQVAEDEGVDLKECAAVGDYINDIPMFKLAGFSIAFNPKHEDIVDYADEVVMEKDLTKILRFFDR